MGLLQWPSSTTALAGQGPQQRMAGNKKGGLNGKIFNRLFWSEEYIYYILSLSQVYNDMISPMAYVYTLCSYDQSWSPVSRHHSVPLGQRSKMI